ncbi:MAG: hypothetical protein JO318_16220 [Chloroflexi bacterium]|nr:hypothetical protein [Chloroflexota bacterium]
MPEALELIRDVGAPRGYLTHVSHALEHAATNARVGPNVEVAYDGLELTV